jgi:hypothetical protein
VYGLGLAYKAPPYTVPISKKKKDILWQRVFVPLVHIMRTDKTAIQSIVILFDLKEKIL